MEKRKNKLNIDINKLRREKKAEKKRNRYMFLVYLISGIVVLSVVLLLIFLPKYPKIQYNSDEGVYEIAKTGVKYNYAPVCYEPVSVGSKYARYGKDWLYQVLGTAPTKWLSEEYDGIGSVFYSTDLKLPTLTEFEADKIYICTSGDTVVSLAEIDDADLITKAADMIENGNKLESRPESEQYYHLKFASKKYPFLYYDVIFIQNTEGNYIYNRGYKYSVEVGSIFSEYITDLGSEE